MDVVLSQKLNLRVGYNRPTGRRLWRVFNLVLGGLLLFGAGCATVSTQQGKLLHLEEEVVATEMPRLQMVIAPINYTSTLSAVQVLISGEQVSSTKRREIYELNSVTNSRAFDPVEFPVLTTRRFGTVLQVGGFTQSRRFFAQEDEPFSHCASVDWFPWLTSINLDGLHFAHNLNLKEADKFVLKTDGKIESPILPYTISGEWLASIPVTVGFVGLSAITLGVFPVVSGVAIAGAEASGKGSESDNMINMKTFWMGPVTLVGAPLKDAVVLAADASRMAGAAILDVAKIAGVVVYDLGTMIGAVCVDTVWKGLTLTADVGLAAGDLFHLAKVERSRTVLPETDVSPWVLHVETNRVSFAAFDLVTEAEGRQWRTAVDTQGQARVKLTDICNASSKAPITLWISVVRRSDGWVAVEPREVVVDQQRLFEQLNPKTKRDVYGLPGNIRIRQEAD